MKCKEIISILESKWPAAYALDWDNVGLLVGDKDQDVRHIFVALDVTDETLQQAIECGADMIITHHPLMFVPMKKIVADDFIGRRIMKMIKYDIAYYAMHTNFDVKGMADLNALSLNLQESKVLEITSVQGDEIEGIGRVGVLSKEMTLEAFALYVKECLGLENVRVYGDSDAVIHKAAISSGSGKGMGKAALHSGADVLVTGDVDYHMGIDCVAQGLCVVDAGHYGTEMVFISHVEEQLKMLLPEIIVSVAKINQPFRVC